MQSPAEKKLREVASRLNAGEQVGMTLQALQECIDSIDSKFLLKSFLTETKTHRYSLLYFLRRIPSLVSPEKIKAVIAELDQECRKQTEALVRNNDIEKIETDFLTIGTDVSPVLLEAKKHNKQNMVQFLEKEGITLTVEQLGELAKHFDGAWDKAAFSKEQKIKLMRHLLCSPNYLEAMPLIQWLVEKGGVSASKTSSENSESLLHVAAAQDHLGAIGAITLFLAFDENIAVNVINRVTGKTPLHVARLPEVVECLLRHGADIFARSVEGETPAETAMNEAVRAALISAEEKIRQDFRSAIAAGNQEPAIKFADAIRLSNFSAIQDLLDFGVQSTEEQMKDILISAVQSSEITKKQLTRFIERFSVSSLFVDETLFPLAVSIDIENCLAEVVQKWNEAFFNAIQENRLQDVEAFIAKGFDPKTVRSPFRSKPRGAAGLNSALHYADTPEMILLLLKHGANVNAKNEAHVTSLWEAICLEKVELVRCLVENGADVLDFAGESPLLRFITLVKGNRNNANVAAMQPIIYAACNRQFQPLRDKLFSKETSVSEQALLQLNNHSVDVISIILDCPNAEGVKLMEVIPGRHRKWSSNYKQISKAASALESNANKLVSSPRLNSWSAEASKEEGNNNNEVKSPYTLFPSERK